MQTYQIKNRREKLFYLGLAIICELQDLSAETEEIFSERGGEKISKTNII